MLFRQVGPVNERSVHVEDLPPSGGFLNGFSLHGEGIHQLDGLPRHGFEGLGHRGGHLSGADPPEGLLILGGILDTQADNVIQAASQNGLNLIDTLTEQDWVVLVLQKA